MDSPNPDPNEAPSKPTDPEMVRSSPERVLRYHRMGVLVMASVCAGYVALWIGFQVFSRYPLEFRENAVLFTADLQHRGENPYALEYRPVFVNVYGIGYY